MQAKPQWTSRFAFVMAAIGSAVGLGNFWRFPYLAGENGGGAFVIIYLGAVFLIVAPIFAAEVALGRRGGGNAVSSLRRLAAEAGASPAWTGIGWLGITCAFIVLSFYSVIGGWVLVYVLKAVTGELAGATAARADGLFAGFLGSVRDMTLAHLVFMGLTAGIVAAGVKGGIERAVTILMPAFFVVLAGLAVVALAIGDPGAAIGFLFSPDFSKVTPAVVLAAVSQAFFSLSLGLTTLLTFGAYLPRSVSIPQTTIVIALSDTLVAVVAGLAIFPLVFGFGLEAGQGPGLLFVTLPIVFGGLPLGSLIAAVFFLLAAVAAITSSISILEVVVAWAEDRFKVRRAAAALVIGALCAAVGMLTVLSFNVLAEFHPLAALPGFAEKTVFDVLDFVTTNIGMPIGGLLVALFAGWALPRATMQAELAFPSQRGFDAWRAAVRYVAPAVMVWVFLNLAGIL